MYLFKIRHKDCINLSLQIYASNRNRLVDGFIYKLDSTVDTDAFKITSTEGIIYVDLQEKLSSLAGQTFQLIVAVYYNDDDDGSLTTPVGNNYNNSNMSNNSSSNNTGDKTILPGGNSHNKIFITIDNVTVIVENVNTSMRRNFPFTGEPTIKF